MFSFFITLVKVNGKGTITFQKMYGYKYLFATVFLLLAFL